METFLVKIKVTSLSLAMLYRFILRSEVHCELVGTMNATDSCSCL